MTEQRTEELWRSRIKLPSAELIVYTSDCYCPVTDLPLNYICGDSLAQSVGEKNNQALLANVSPDLEEFIVKTEKRFGKHSGIPKDQLTVFNAWDTMTAARLLMSFCNPKEPVRNLSISNIIIKSALLDFCIDHAFHRWANAHDFMQIRIAERRLQQG